MCTCPTYFESIAYSFDSFPYPFVSLPRACARFRRLVGAVDIVVDKKRVDGSRVRLAEVEVGDETGRVSLRARDDQIDLLREVSDRAGAVVLRNCTLELFQGKHIRLAVTKWGKIAPYPDHIASTPVPPSKMNEDRFFSLIDLSVVAIDASVHSQGEGYAQSADNESTGFSNASGGGRGRNAGRKQPRPNKPMAPYPVSAPVGYADGNMMRFQGGLHGYGYVENLDSYGYRQRQPEHMASAQMLLQQQYEMHQRQIQQMYHDNRQPHGPADPSNPSTMHAAGMPPAASFEGGFGVPPRGDVFVNHGMSPQPNVFQQSPGHHGTPDRGQPNVGSHFPVSPRMNPRAATFDPNTPGPHGGHG